MTDQLGSEFTVSLWLEVPSDRSGVAGGLASRYDHSHEVGVQPERDLECRRLQRTER